MSFGVTRAEGLSRLLTTAPAEADSFDFFRLATFDFLNSELMELMVDCTLAGISCMYTSVVVAVAAKPALVQISTTYGAQQVGIRLPQAA